MRVFGEPLHPLNRITPTTPIRTRRTAATTGMARFMRIV
jgi:hypothetical protein